MLQILTAPVVIPEPAHPHHLECQSIPKKCPISQIKKVVHATEYRRKPRDFLTPTLNDTQRRAKVERGSVQLTKPLAN